AENGEAGPNIPVPCARHSRPTVSATNQMRSVKQSGTPSAIIKQNQEPSPASVQNVNPTEKLIRRKFQEYYLSLSKKFYLPPHPEEREYGLLIFKEKFMVRYRTLLYQIL